MNLRIKTLSIIILSAISSCKNEDEKKQNFEKTLKDSISSSEYKRNDSVDILSHKDTLLYSNENLEVYQEYITRGDGIVNLSFENELVFYNLDGTVYGNIVKKEESVYEFNLPKKMIARYIVPDFDKFSFDAENPQKNNELISIYINKEIKTIKKSGIEFQFTTWNDYMKNSIFKTFSDNKNIFKVIKIIDENNVLAKTTNIEDCGGEKINSQDNFEKNIEWRTNDIMNVEFYECD